MQVFNTTGNTVFKAVIEKMEQKGFQVLAQVSSDSIHDGPYHVPVKYAKHTRLFFNWPEKTLIVMLELSEIWHQSGRFQRYWSGFVVASWNNWKLRRDRCRHEALVGIPYNNDDIEYNPADAFDHMGAWISSFEGSIKTIRFEPNQNNYQEEDAWNGRGLVDLCAPFGRIVTVLGPYLYHQFRDLQVTDFSPCYTFPESESLFWKRFPIERLTQLVSGKLWGSKFS